MPRHRNGFIGLNGGDADVDAGKKPAPAKMHAPRHIGIFWKWGCILLIFVAVGLSTAALVFAMSEDAHWQYDADTARITSRHNGTDVEIKEGGNLVVHGNIVDNFEHIIYEKIVLNPLFGPEGPDLLFGAADATYTRLQAFFAVGIRVWSRSFIPIGGVFAPNGLFGEDALAIMVGSFATWIHGPIIGTGPAVLVISDANAKENVRPLDPQVALDKIARLEPRSFDWKGAKSAAAGKLAAQTRRSMLNVHGFVAQEVGAVIPSAVHNTNDYLPEGTSLTPQALMDYNAIVVELVGAVQSLWANSVTAAALHVVDDNIRPCADGVQYPTQRSKARCICEAIHCGPTPTPTCTAVLNACGTPLLPQ